MKRRMRSFVVRSLDELRDHRDGWEALRADCRASVFSSFDLVHLWLDNYRGEVRPRVVMVEERGDLVGVAPLFVYKHRAMGLPVATLSLVGNHRHLIGYSLETVMARDAEPKVLEEMLRRIKAIRWNLLQIFDMDPNICTLRLLDGVRGEMEWQPYLETYDRWYEFPVDGDIADGFGKRTRKNLNTIRNRLEREGRASLRTVSSEEGMERAMRLYIDMHGSRWRGKGGSVFQKPGNGRLLVEMGKLAGRTGTGVVQELLIDGEVAGQLLSFFDGDVSRAYRLSMADGFRELSPGRLTMAMAMEDHRARGLRAMDFLHGDEDYKLHLCNGERRLEAVQVLRGSLQAMSRVRAFPPVRLLDERLGMRDRMLNRIYKG